MCRGVMKPQRAYVNSPLRKLKKLSYTDITIKMLYHTVMPYQSH